MRTRNSRRWVIGLLLLGSIIGGARWRLGPLPHVHEIRRSSFFSTRFPLIIQRPGHYRLMTDLVVTDRDLDAIQILTYGVTVDLNGFTVTGPQRGGRGRGISTGGVDRHYLTVSNGTIAGFGGGGVELPGLYQRAESLTITHNAGYGVTVGPKSVIIANRIDHNGGGVNVSRGESRIWQNTIQHNRGHGIEDGGGSWVEKNTIEDNSGEGMFVTVGSSLYGNVVRHSGRNGLLLGAFVTVEANEIRGNREAGVMTYGKSNRILKNLITDNLGVGVKLDGPDNYLARNTFQRNAIGAMTEETDDTVARNDDANIFLLASGEIDQAAMTKRRSP
jgi:hypothetical protein